MITRLRTGVPLLVFMALMGVLAGCATHWATSTSDQSVCVFDGSERGGQKLKFQVAPGAESKKIDGNDQVVKIPASNRFYMAAENDNTRDPRAPKFYEGSAKGSVGVKIQGQIRFRFNLKLACEWYSKHGRRNADEDGDLGFNKRGPEAADAGWFRYLAENFGVTMAEVVTENLSQIDWPAMVYNYPDNADESGVVPEDESPGDSTNLVLGRSLGEAFSERLKDNLGGNYFCGIDPVEDAKDKDCPPMRFQVIRVHTTRPELETSRDALEAKRQKLREQELEGEITKRQADVLREAAESKQALLEQDLRTAELQAQIDTAKCRALADKGLDCDGKLPPVIVAGGQGG